MSTVTENDLREIKDLINTRFNDLEKKLDLHIVRADERFKAIDQRFDGVEQKMAQGFQQVEKRLDDTNKRIDNVDSRLNTFTIGFFGVFGVFVAGLITLIGKIVFFPTP